MQPPFHVVGRHGLGQHAERRAAGLQRARDVVVAVAEAEVEAQVAAEENEGGPAAETSVEAPQGIDAETLETAGESVEPPDSVPAESDTMKEIHTSVQSPDEKGEVHES